jgi:DNA-binding transcriptional regulator YhcF (GntR family)
MEDQKTPEIVVEPEDKPNLFTQEDVSNVVAKNVKEERAKLLKELGIEDIDNAKEALKAYRELQDKQKGDLEKTKEEKEAIATENATLKAQLKAIETEKTLNKVLTEMQIDGNYHKAIMKLIAEVPEDEKELKELISSTIKEFLPGAIETKDVGFEKKADKKPEGGTKQYLNDKYKNNPFYKG